MKKNYNYKFPDLLFGGEFAESLVIYMSNEIAFIPKYNLLDFRGLLK